MNAKQILEDNARKFIVSTAMPQLFKPDSVISYDLTTDWLETNTDNEKKLVYKRFNSGEVQHLLISKVTKDGSRVSEKIPIDETKYAELSKESLLHLEKKRFEASLPQNGQVFSLKYDEFAGSDLRILEVDAESDEERALFEPDDFPAALIEVTGDLRYYGYRIADQLHK